MPALLSLVVRRHNRQAILKTPLPPEVCDELLHHEEISRSVTDTERQRRSERVRDMKRAVRRGESVERRDASRELRADLWTEWFRRRLDTLGGDPVQHLPELEERIDDQVAAAIRQLKADLKRALG